MGVSAFAKAFYTLPFLLGSGAPPNELGEDFVPTPACESGGAPAEAVAGDGDTRT